jgi:hypothetical protein
VVVVVVVVVVMVVMVVVVVVVIMLILGLHGEGKAETLRWKRLRPRRHQRGRKGRWMGERKRMQLIWQEV